MKLNRSEIEALCEGNEPLIAPYKAAYKWNGLSAGADYHGYVLTLGNFWTEHNPAIVDSEMLHAEGKTLSFVDSDRYTLGPGSSVLAGTEQIFNMPRNMIGIIHVKSSLVRFGITTPATVVEAGWFGRLTLLIANTSRYTQFILREGMPIAQVMFERVTPNNTAYSGKFQGTTAPTVV